MMNPRIPPPPVPADGWLATLQTGGSGSPVYFAWDGDLYSSDPGMLNHLRAMAADLWMVGATPTGPFAPVDFTLGHAAYALVVRLAEATGGELSVEGEGWRWPDVAEDGAEDVPADSDPDAVY